MDQQQQQQQQTPATSASTSAASQPSEPPPPPQQQPQSQPQPPSSIASSSSATATPSSTPVPSSPNPNPSTKPSTPLPNQPPQPQSQSFQSSSQARPPTFPRPWQQTSHFPHFSSHLSSLPPSSTASSGSGPSLSTTGSPSVSTPPPPRGGMAIGVPAQHPTPPPQSVPFSSSFGQQFGGLGRSGVNVPEPASNSNASQVRPPMQGMQGMGMVGSLGSTSQMRPAGIPAHHQQRPVQSSLRQPSSPNNQSPAPQNFQGHGLLRGSSAGSPASPSPNASQSMQSLNQPWLSSGGPHGKPPLPSPSYRGQMNSPSLQQRSHIPQQHHPPSQTVSQPQHVSSTQAQQPSQSHQPQEHHGPQFPPSRVSQSLPHQQQITRVQASGNQKPSSLAMVQPNTVQPGTTLNKTASTESDESNTRILSKRSIHELVSQIDPSERLDPEVEDILVDIAEDFIDSITTFGCSLAKHRKSNMLEAKDILLHLERNWNMSLPGFSGDEIKTYRKPPTNDVHRERLAVIKRSVVANEMGNAKNPAGQAAGNVKGNLAKTPANTFGSPNVKTREVS